MLKLVIIILGCLVGALQGLNLPIQRNCAKEAPSSRLSPAYYENMAHAVHSMTVTGLRMFNPRAGPNNMVPTVNLNVSAPNKVVPNAPEDPLPEGYVTPPMRTFDKIMSHVGRFDDGLGPHWSPIERVAHTFHMQDLWERVRREYTATVIYSPPSDDTCACVTDVNKNGVTAAVNWVANHYKTGTPITLLNRPIPKLTNADTWKVWKQRLLHYYTQPALYDAAVYMYCAVKDL